MSRPYQLKGNINKEIYSLKQVIQHFKLPSIVTLLGIILSIASFIMALNNNMNTIKKDFETYGNAQFSALNHRFNGYLRGLEIAHAGYTHQKPIDEKQFAKRIEPLFKRGKFTAFYWVNDNGSKLEVEYYRGKNGDSLEGSFDINANKKLVSAIERSRQSKTIVVSQPFSSSPKRASNSDLAFILPVVSKSHLKGFIVGVLDLKQVFTHEVQWDNKYSDINVLIFDVTHGDKSLFYFHNNKGHHFSQAGEVFSDDPSLRLFPFSFERSFSIGSREWQVTILPTQNLIAATGFAFPWVYLTLGVMLTSLLAVLLFSLTSRNIQVQALVNQKTASLKESEERLRAVLETVADGIITISNTGVIQSFNTSAERIFGHVSREVIGQNVKMLMANQDCAEHDGYIDNHLKTLNSEVTGAGKEVQALRKDGEIFPMELAVNEMTISGQKFFVGSLRDISDRKKAEKALIESETKIRAIVENTVDGLITIDNKGRIETYNTACEKIFGYLADEVIGNNVKMLMPEPYHSEHDGYLKNYTETGKAKIIGVGREIQGRRKDGSKFPLELSVSEVDLEGRKIFSGIVRDITVRKEMEKALKQSNEELERFAYVASHDLKAPLRAIDSLSQWIEEDLGEVLVGEIKENMGTLRNRVHRMEKLLDDLLEFSRIGKKTDKSFQEVVSGDVLLNDIICLIAPPDGFSVDIDPGFSSVNINRMPLQQILFNLINNAIKHHDKDTGTVRAKVSSIGNHHIFEVEDDGPGIPSEFQNKVFEMFQTLKPRDEIEGSGIGLAIVKKIIDNNGGEIELKSQSGCGSRFRFTWPRVENV